VLFVLVNVLFVQCYTDSYADFTVTYYNSPYCSGYITTSYINFAYSSSGNSFEDYSKCYTSYGSDLPSGVDSIYIEADSTCSSMWCITANLYPYSSCTGIRTYSSSVLSYSLDNGYFLSTTTGSGVAKSIKVQRSDYYTGYSSTVRLTTGGYVGISIAAVVAVIAIIACVVYGRRRRLASTAYQTLNPPQATTVAYVPPSYGYAPQQQPIYGQPVTQYGQPV